MFTIKTTQNLNLEELFQYACAAWAEEGKYYRKGAVVGSGNSNKWGHYSAVSYNNNDEGFISANEDKDGLAIDYGNGDCGCKGAG